MAGESVCINAVKRYFRTTVGGSQPRAAGTITTCLWWRQYQIGADFLKRVCAETPEFGAVLMEQIPLAHPSDGWRILELLAPAE